VSRAASPAALSVVQHSLLQGQGGAARVADHLAQGLADLGRTCLRTFEAPDDAPDVAAGIVSGVVAGVAAGLGADGGARLLESARAGALLHLHASADWAGLLTALARAGARGRTVLTLHDCRLFTGGCPYPLDCDRLAEGCAPSCPRGFPDAAAHRAAVAGALAALAPVCVAPSRWMKELAGRCLPGQAVRIIPNGVPFPDPAAALPSRTEARRAFGIDPAAPVALLAAHGAEAAQYKGGHLWDGLRAAVSARLPGLLWVVAGGGELSAASDLMRLPYLSQDRLALLMRAADLFVYPSLADNHPLVVLEAMAVALPTVAFAVGGVPEEIADGVTGFLVPPGDWQGMAARTAGLLAAPGLLRRVGATARRGGRKRFGLERMVRDYAALYASLGH